MAPDWLDVWRRKGREAAGEPTLARLLAADGFDVLGVVSEAAWLAHADRIAARLEVAPGESVFDTGCGAGAFLLPFHRRGHPVGGLDYAAELLQVARGALPGADLVAAEAVQLDVSRPYDVVLAHGSFFYFPDLDYARRTLERMVAKARRAVAVLDVPDLATREDAERARRRAVGTEEYERRYRGLDHLYFSRDWFRAALRGVAAAIAIEAQDIPGYPHNPYRFNVFVERRACSAR